MIADAGVTLAWQEPVSRAARGARQNQLAGAAATRIEAADAARSARAIARADAAAAAIAFLARARRRRPGRWPSGGIAADRPARRRRRAGHRRRPTCARGRASTPATPFPGARGTTAIAGHRTTYLAPVPPRRRAAPRRRDRAAAALRALPLPRRGPADRRARRRICACAASATTGSCSRPAIRSVPPRGGSSCSARLAGVGSDRPGAPAPMREPIGRADNREDRMMKLAELKAQIARAEYVVDPDVVAEAFVRRVCRRARESRRRSADAMLVAAQRACSAARAERHAGLAGRHPCRPPSAPARAARRAAGTRTARSPRRRSPRAPAARRRAAPPPRRRPARAAARRGRSRSPRRCARARWRASVARPSERSIIAWAPARPARGPRPGAARGAGRRARASAPPCARPSSTASPAAGGAERAGHPDEVAGARAVAADELLARVGPADDGDGERQRRARARGRRRRSSSPCARPAPPSRARSSSTASCPRSSGTPSAT